MVVGLIVAVVFLGPKNPSAKQCYETEAADDDKQWSPGERERLGHLAYDYVSCQRGCDNEDDAYSCGNVAHVYAMGKGLRYDGEVDYGKAAEYAERACSLRAEGTCVMGKRYRCYQDIHACEGRCFEGTGTDCASLAAKVDRRGKEGFDADRAIKFHGLACQSAEEKSCDKEVELTCATKPTACADGCKGGNARMCFKLGENFEHGGGEVSKNPQKAVEFKRRACELDDQVHETCAKVLNEAAISL